MDGPRIDPGRLRSWKASRRVTTRALARRTKEVDPERKGVSYHHLTKVLLGQVPGRHATELLLAALGSEAGVVVAREEDQGPVFARVIAAAFVEALRAHQTAKPVQSDEEGAAGPGGGHGAGQP